MYQQGKDDAEKETNSYNPEQLIKMVEEQIARPGNRSD